MCRLAAYLGKEISLSEFLLKPEHSLVKQAWAPKEMLEGTVNADGFGFAWLDQQRVPGVYKNVLPIWSDNNLNSLGDSIHSGLWLANVRGATPGQGISETNTQPFIKNNLIFTHNGCLKPFNNEIKTTILNTLPGHINANINGDSDSLYLLAMLEQQLKKENDISSALKNMFEGLQQICGDSISALVNIIVSDGEKLFACRHAFNSSCPSLYYLSQADCIWVTSEPLTPDQPWEPLPEHSLFIFDRSANIEKHEL